MPGMDARAPERTETAADPKIRQVLSFINENLAKELTVELLADSVYMSRYHFMR